MELTEDEVIKSTAKNVDIAIEKQYYHKNLNLLVFHADIL